MMRTHRWQALSQWAADGVCWPMVGSTSATMTGFASDYSKLAALLTDRAEQGQGLCVLSFDEIEALVGPLPPGAAHKKSWWIGKQSPQATAWRNAGWAVDTVGFAARKVAFRRLK